MTTQRVELPEKLIPVFLGEADVRGAYGGRGSAKTRSFAKMTAVSGIRFDAAGREGVIVCGRQFQNSLDDSSFAEVAAAIKSEFWLLAQYEIGERYIRTLSGRIKYSFIGVERNLGSIKSKSGILLFWIDEAEAVREAAWQIIIPTLREDGVELWVTWNPETVGSATDRRFRGEAAANDPRYKVIPLNWRDNRKFPDALERTRRRDLAERPEDYDWVWEGAYRTAVAGAIFAAELAKADVSGRIGLVAYDPSKPVHTLWDLGWSDSIAIWFVQRVGLEWRVLKYREFQRKTIAEIAKELQDEPYVYAEHWMPHDADAETLAGDGKSIAEKARALGLKIKVIARVAKKAGAIDSLRTLFASLWFDKEACADGLHCLRNYAYKVDPDTGQASNEPLHNWASHGADALMQLGQGVKDQSARPTYNPEAMRARAGSFLSR